MASFRVSSGSSRRSERNGSENHRHMLPMTDAASSRPPIPIVVARLCAGEAHRLSGIDPEYGRFLVPGAQIVGCRNTGDTGTDHEDLHMIARFHTMSVRSDFYHHKQGLFRRRIRLLRWMCRHHRVQGLAVSIDANERGIRGQVQFEATRIEYLWYEPDVCERETVTV